MTVRSLNALRVFEAVVPLLNFSRAATSLSMSQGAVSYQIKRLEDELGFKLFDRVGRSVRLTAAGAEFHAIASRALGEIDDTAARLRRRDQSELVVGVSTYFGSRWLSPRLMRFIAKHPRITLRFQVMVAQTQLAGTGVDVAVVWGSSEQLDRDYELLLKSRVTPMCGRHTAKALSKKPFGKLLGRQTLIHDDETRDAWQRWLSYAGLSDVHGLQGPIIPDPNMRVQAVIDDQGISIFDDLVASELASGLLLTPHPVWLDGYGYHLVIAEDLGRRKDVAALLDWLRLEAAR
jgi:DNA-binding transcriptional LysR family regulator